MYIDDYKSCFINFDRLHSNQKATDPIYARGTRKDFDVFYLSQSQFDVPKRTTTMNGKKRISIEQTSKSVEIIFRDVAGFDRLQNCLLVIDVSFEKL